MTENIRQSLGLLVVAIPAALVGFLLTRNEGSSGAQNIGGILVLGGIVLGLVGIARLATALLSSPQRDRG